MEKDFLKNAKAKSGVSLVVVMLFMLVATIAATATYKWITSQSRSSSSRMLEREAYQSSLAGIENARAWIAWHANDAGALIRQYFENDKRPIRMDRQLRALQREGQSYSVWLTGVNTEKSTYKLKLLSRGVARNGAASHSEVAILNVDGLYQVKIPSEKNASNVDFDYAYFGGSTNNHGSMNPTAMLVNGNWSGNPNTVTKNFVVTGNAELSGDNIHVGGTACIGGNLSTQNGFTGKNLYLAGNTSNFNGILTGDAYLDGDFTVGSACGKNFSILGNVTLNGTLNPGDCAGKRIEGNLCVAESGRLETSGGNNAFEVHGNIWMPGDLNVWYNGGDDNYDSYDKIVLGKKAESAVYIKTAHPWSDYDALRSNRTATEKSTNDTRMCTQYGNGMPTCTQWTGWGWGLICVKWENASKCDHWDHWEGYPYSPYPEKKNEEKKDDLYYLYAVEDGVKDVEFKEYNNTYWGRYMSAYHVGGLLFYDTYSVWNEYHYSNGKPTGSPYCKKRGNYSPGATSIDAHRPVCGVNPWFKSNGNVSRNLPAEVPFECAENVKADCDSIWKKEPGCDGSNYKVEDMLVTAYDKFESFADKDCAKNITQWDNNLSKKMNACYDEITKDSDKNRAKENLYNGYLVVKVRSDNLQNPSEALKGKFIIVVTNEIGQQNLPPTTSDSYVFLFLKEGGKYASLQPQGSGDFNYFIYTEKDVGQILFNNSKLSGSVYAAASTCSKVADLTIKEIEYNKSLLEDLASSGIICDNDGSPCGGSSGGSGSSSGESGNVEYGGLDPHYISMAPQLGVTLESQYESREASPENADETRIDSAYIVLPRVIYLAANPKGTLADYFNVLALNGSKLKKGDVSVNSCASDDASLAVSGALYGGTALRKGVYECRTSASGYAENVPFWVVVGSEESDAPSAYFAQESQGISATGSAPITLVVEPFVGELTLKFTESDLPAGWNRSAAAGLSCSGGSSGNCEFKLNGTGDRREIVLYTVTTSGATSGTFTVQLMEGEGYRIGSPWFSEVHVSSNIRITRGEISAQELKDYCDGHSDECPKLSNGWPKGNCESSEWVSVTSGLACGTAQRNEAWNCVAGGSGTGTLVRAASIKSGCVAIIPTENNSFDLSRLSADDSRELRASVYAKKRRMVVGFTGDVGGNHPKIDIVIERSTGTVIETCDYDSETDETKRCAIDVFEGDAVTLKLDTSSTDHRNFNYWKCENADGNCPSGSEVLSNTVYPAFTIQGSAEYTLMAHFGEADGHCFFDEFNREDVICGAGLSEKEYCIDNCQGSGEGVCAGVSNGPTYAKAKWNLVAGALENILYRDGSVSVVRTAKRGDKPEQSAVRVMSTVAAGLYGTMKALVQIPKATSGADRSGAGIRNSGLVLRSNGSASEYLMLNVYANASGNLEVQLCNEKGDACKTGVLEDNGSSASVSANAMVMVAATLASEESGDVLLVEAYKENYYGSPKAYSHRFVLDGNFAKYLNRANEYVGFGIADANFKIYGIGWKSEDYGSECHDTYPTVKCSFRAVAENGIVPTGKDVKPWLGHSAWFNSRDCSERYFYENGADACGASENGRAECLGAYRFSADGAGLHGYSDDEKRRVKAAVASLHCSGLSDSEGWALGEEADCGKFWTGEFKECSNHEILKNDVAEYAAGEERCEKFDVALNLRSAQLNVELESVNGIGENPDLEIFLLSENAAWGKDDFESQSVRVSRFGSSSFDVVGEMTANADGFDPEHVSGVCFKNGGVPVRVKTISSNCANAISLSACRVEYAGGNQWNVEADVANPEKIQSFTVTRKVEGDSRQETFVCGGADSKCLFDAQTAKLGFADSRNPYKDDQGKSYAFQISLVGNEGNTTLEKECSVSPSTIGKITATCEISGSNSVAQGKGLPHFRVKFSGCPAKGCAWKITTDDGKISESGSAENFDSEFSGENTAESPWNAGTYLYKVESGDADYPFDGCSVEFTVTEAKSSSSSEAAESSSSATAAGESSSSGENLSVTCGISTHKYEIYSNENYESKVFYFMMKNNVNTNGTYPIELYSGNNLLKSFELNNWSNWSVETLGKLTSGLHSYSARYRGQEICNASIQVVSPLSCSADKTEIGIGDDCIFTAAKLADCWSCSYSDSDTSFNNYDFSAVTRAFASVGKKELKITCTCENTEAACSTSVTVSEVAPTVECPDKLTKMVGSTVFAKPKSLTGCASGGGCDWTLNDVNSEIAGGKLKNGEMFSFAGASSAGTKNYTLRVSNGKGSASCNFDVEYSANEGIVFNPTGIYTAGTYLLKSCNGSTGIKDVQIDSANMQNCLSIFASSESDTYWNNDASNCNGGTKVSFPTEMTIPEGVTVVFKNGCW